MKSWVNAWERLGIFLQNYNKMTHINLENELLGIRGLMAFRPVTALPINILAEILLRSNERLNKGERGLIATFVSSLNDCLFC